MLKARCQYRSRSEGERGGEREKKRGWRERERGRERERDAADLQTRGDAFTFHLTSLRLHARGGSAVQEVRGYREFGKVEREIIRQSETGEGES